MYCYYLINSAFPFGLCYHSYFDYLCYYHKSFFIFELIIEIINNKKFKFNIKNKKKIKFKFNILYTIFNHQEDINEFSTIPSVHMKQLINGYEFTAQVVGPLNTLVKCKIDRTLITVRSRTIHSPIDLRRMKVNIQ